MSQALTPARRSQASGPDMSALSPQEIQSELEVTRIRLAKTINQLTYRVSPKTIIKRKIDEIKAEFVDEHGAPRTDRIAVASGAALGVAVFFVVVRKIVNRD